MITKRTLTLVLCAHLVALVLSSCEKEGPAERMGKEIDKAVEQASEEIDKAVEQAGEAMKKAGDQAQEATQ